MTVNLFAPPRLHRGPAEEHRKATWLELFYDLVYVATIVQLGDHLSDDVSWAGALSYFIMFIPIWWSWVGTTFYDNRFDSDDMLHRVLVFLQVYTVGTMAIFVYDGLGQGAAGFALAYAANRAILIVMYLRARYFIPEARDLADRYVPHFAAAAALWVISAFIPSPARFGLWIVAIAIDLYTPLSRRSRQLQAQLPPSPHHLPERFGLLTIIVMGESFLKIIGGLAGEPIDLAALIANFPSLLIIGALWWIYFDNVAEAIVRGGTRAAQVWLFAHLLFQGAVAAVGVGMYKLITLEPDYPLPENYRLLIALSTTAAWIALGIIELATIERGGERKSDIDFALRIVTALVILALGLLGGALDEIVIMLLIALACLSQVVADVFMRIRFGAQEPLAIEEGIELSGTD